MPTIYLDDDVSSRNGEHYNAALVRNLLLREPLLTDIETPNARSDPPTVPVPETAIPSTSLGLWWQPVS